MRLTTIVTVFTLFLSACTAVNQSLDRQAEKSGVEVPLKKFIGDLKSIQVGVSGQEYDFLFDTAGGLTIISPAVAERIKCEPIGRFVGFRMSGERVELSKCGSHPIKIAGLSLKPELYVLDLNALLPDSVPPIPGVISLHTFEDQIVSLDLGRDRLFMENKSSLSKRIMGMSPTQIRYSRQGGGASLDVMIAIQSPVGLLWFEVDSGCLGPVPIPIHTQKQLGIDLIKDSTSHISVEVAGAGTLQLLAHEKDIIYDGVIGAAALKHLVLTLDLITQRAWAKIEE